MKFEIRIYPLAVLPATDDDALDLGAVGDVIATIDAEYPSAAIVAAEPTILATRSETTTRMQRGKRVTLTTFYVTCDATAAWMTARGLAALRPA